MLRKSSAWRLLSGTLSERGLGYVPRYADEWALFFSYSTDDWELAAGLQTEKGMHDEIVGWLDGERATL